MEFFVVMNSYAAPFFSDTSEKFLVAKDIEECKRRVIDEYTHPCGLYFAAIYSDANAFHKGAEPLAKYLCGLEKRKHEVTKDMGSYTYEGMGRVAFKVNGRQYTVEDEGGWL